MQNNVDRMELKVPVGSGYLIGNTLRQFALRGPCTWQPAGYRISNREGTFGLGGGYTFSVLTFLNGYLEPNYTSDGTNYKLCTFVKSGDDYVCDDMVLKNLKDIGASSIEVCLVYSSGSRTEEQNYSVVKELCFNNADEFICVPSNHTDTIKFKFNVNPYDSVSELLCIEATSGSVLRACNSAVRALSGLNIPN